MLSLAFSIALAIILNQLIAKKISPKNRYRDVILSATSIVLLFVAFAVVQFVFIFLGII